MCGRPLPFSAAHGRMLTWVRPAARPRSDPVYLPRALRRSVQIWLSRTCLIRDRAIPPSNLPTPSTARDRCSSRCDRSSRDLALGQQRPKRCAMLLAMATAMSMRGLRASYPRPYWSAFAGSPAHHSTRSDDQQAAQSAVHPSLSFRRASAFQPWTVAKALVLGRRRNRDLLRRSEGAGAARLTAPPWHIDDRLRRGPSIISARSPSGKVYRLLFRTV